MGRMDAKVALISGGARGQGEAEARLFVAEGASVVIGDLLDEQGAKVAADLGDRAAYCHLDVTQPEDWQTAVATVNDRFGRLDVLINNAGIVRLGMMLDVTLEEYRHVVDTNQIGCWLGMKTSAPLMAETGGGSIIRSPAWVAPTRWPKWRSFWRRTIRRTRPDRSSSSTAAGW
jgi:3alpha(or 20beta)-hydroxysteroid dehydrogenase